MESTINKLKNYEGRNIGYYLAISPSSIACIFLCWYLASYHWLLFIIGLIFFEIICYYLYSFIGVYIYKKSKRISAVEFNIYYFIFQVIVFGVATAIYFLI
jgi:hypothetical protein